MERGKNDGKMVLHDYRSMSGGELNLYFENWSDEFFNEAKKTKFLRLVSPFVQYPTIKKIMEISALEHIQLITRLNERDFASGVSSLRAIKFAVEKGATVYGIKKLHSKVYIFDRRTATITSSNLTESGLAENIECGVCLNDTAVINELNDYFDDLVRGLSAVTIEKCDEIQKSIDSKKIILPNFGSLVDHGAKANKRNKGPAYYVKFFGKGDEKEPYSYSVRDYINDSGSHYALSFPKNKRPRQVKTGDIIFIACMVHSPSDYAIFGRAEAIQHDDKRDNATPEEIKRRSWKEQWPAYLRTTNGVFIDGRMEDCPMLWKDVLNKFGSRIFEETRKHVEAGEKDIEPKHSVMRKAYIRLSEEAACWLDKEFQAALTKKGAIDREYLDSLPK